MAVSHRVGRLAVGEVALACAVATAHRAQAFALCAAVVEAIKAETSSTWSPAWRRSRGRRDRLGDTLAGIDAAITAGLAPVKLNTVLVRGVNDDEAPDLLRFALGKGAELRFIEQMPLDAGHTWTREGMISADEVQARLAGEFDLEPLPGRGAAPAERFAVRARGGSEPLGTVGIIASVTRPFCGQCDRLRLTADGQLRSCLFARGETDLRTPLRAGASGQELTALVHACLAGKAPGHGIDNPDFLQPPRPMSAIGG